MFFRKSFKIRQISQFLVVIWSFTFLFFCLVPQVVCAEKEMVDLLDDEYFEEEYDGEDSFEDFQGVEIYDPLEPLNRVVFEFNDKLYFWVLKPVKVGYSAVIPGDFRLALGNFFYNIASPIRFVNNILQGEVEDAGLVLSRFAINSTMGVFGFGDPAAREFQLDPRPADFGQTLGKWGIGEGVYFCWPLVGPSNIRDTVGLAGDVYLHPLYYIHTETIQNISYYAGTRINLMSLKPGVYEEMKRFSLDPYVATRQAYYDYRRSIVNQSSNSSGDDQELLK